MAEEPDSKEEWRRYAIGHSSDDPRAFQHYFEVLRRWGTPAEFEAIVKRIGDAARIEQKLDILEARMEAWAWNRRAWDVVGWVLRLAGSAGAVFGALLAARGVWSWLSGG